MRYCADTWFILSLFDKNENSISILEETSSGKSYIFIPIVVFAESTKKLLQKGIAHKDIDLFWRGVEASEKVKVIFADKNVAGESAKVSLAYGLSMMDSFVASTCHLTYCDSLLSGDSDYKILVKKKYLKVKSW